MPDIAVLPTWLIPLSWMGCQKVADVGFYLLVTFVPSLIVRYEEDGKEVPRFLKRHFGQFFSHGHVPYAFGLSDCLDCRHNGQLVHRDKLPCSLIIKTALRLV